MGFSLPGGRNAHMLNDKALMLSLTSRCALCLPRAGWRLKSTVIEPLVMSKVGASCCSFERIILPAPKHMQENASLIAMLHIVPPCVPRY